MSFIIAPSGIRDLVMIQINGVWKAFKALESMDFG